MQTRERKKGCLLLFRSLVDTAPEQKTPTLSKRELEVLLRMREGDADKQIALDLRLSKRTVQHHVQAICLKLSAANRTQAVVMALRRKLISLN